MSSQPFYKEKKGYVRGLEKNWLMGWELQPGGNVSSTVIHQYSLTSECKPCICCILTRKKKCFSMALAWDLSHLLELVWVTMPPHKIKCFIVQYSWVSALTTNSRTNYGWIPMSFFICGSPILYLRSFPGTQWPRYHPDQLLSDSLGHKG